MHFEEKIFSFLNITCTRKRCYQNDFLKCLIGKEFYGSSIILIENSIKKVDYSGLTLCTPVYKGVHFFLKHGLQNSHRLTNECLQYTGIHCTHWYTWCTL